MKKRYLKTIAMSMALMLAMPINVFATPIDLSNSSKSVVTDELDKANGTDHFTDETTNNWQDGSITEETRVTVKRTSNFEVTIPKEIVFDGSTGIATYKVKAKGDIAGDQVLTVTPDASFVLSEAGGKSDVTATVTQPDTEYVYTDLQGDGTEYNGNISATLTAGEWAGKFSFNIEFLAKPKTFNDYSWAEIAAISEVGNAASTFAVGDEKELQIGDETYHVQILGFNHDDKSDGTGKAGITVGLKEVMTTEKTVNSNGSNVGGWRDSEMRTYLQNNVLTSLPSDLQAVIKSVNKISDVGNMNTTSLVTTQDKLFLFSTTEVGGNLFTNKDVDDQGTQYEYFTDDDSRIKENLINSCIDWWLRSTNTGDNTCFRYISSIGYNYGGGTNQTRGVVFGFSI